MEKACKALNDQAIATAGLDAAREELSYLAIKVPNECPPSITLTSSLTHLIAHIKNEHAQNVNSCLSSQADAVKKRQRVTFIHQKVEGRLTLDKLWNIFFIPMTFSSASDLMQGETRYDERPYERILLDTLRIGSNIQEQSGMDSFILEE
ncbi:hypothetical protein Tco_1506087 [Tanacetum coccineum]